MKQELVLQRNERNVFDVILYEKNILKMTSIETKNEKDTKFTETSGIIDSINQCHFDQNHKKYRACCGCHIRGFSLIIGLLEIIGLIASVVGTGVAYFALPNRKSINDQQDIDFGLLNHAEFSFVGSIFALIFGSIVVISMIYGLVRERPTLLLPHLIAQLIAITGLVAIIIFYLYMVINGGPGDFRMENLSSKSRQNEAYETEMVYGIIVISLCVLACVLEIYFITVVYRAYDYFCAKMEAKEKLQNSKVKKSMISFPGQDSIAMQRFSAQN